MKKHGDVYKEFIFGIIIDQTISVSSESDEMQNFIMFAMNAYHNQQAYLRTIIAIVVSNDILTVLKFYTSGIDDISTILMLLFMDWCIVSDSSDACMLIFAVSQLCFLAFQLFIINYSIFNGFPAT